MSELPSISCVCVTYGRVRWLQEALACFLAQDYQGPHELVVLNTCPQQNLEVAPKHFRQHQDFQIHNLAQRPASLGAARNLAVKFAKGDMIVTFDDDDLCKPTLLSIYAKYFTSDWTPDWVRLNPTFYAEGYSIKGTFKTWINSVAFRKSAFEKVGGYDPALSVGEDQKLFSKLSAECLGVTVELSPEEMPWIYCWGNGVYHASGHGVDKSGTVTAWERCRIDLERRLRTGQEPSGVIKVEPRLEHDPVQMVSTWLATQKKTT